jgi:hypothetical protein
MKKKNLIKFNLFISSISNYTLALNLPYMIRLKIY